MIPYLAQNQRGEWFLYSDHIPEPIPVPNWIVELCPRDDREFLARGLGQIYGTGRVVGRQEGAQAKLEDIRNVLEIE